MKCIGDHFRFGSVRFLPIKNNQIKKTKPNQNRSKLTGFGLVFDAQNRKNLYTFSIQFFSDPNYWES
jgi:hypothetical protein